MFVGDQNEDMEPTWGMLAGSRGGGQSRGATPGVTVSGTVSEAVKPGEATKREDRGRRTVRAGGRGHSLPDPCPCCPHLSRSQILLVVSPYAPLCWAGGHAVLRGRLCAGRGTTTIRRDVHRDGRAGAVTASLPPRGSLGEAGPLPEVVVTSLSLQTDKSWALCPGPS